MHKKVILAGVFVASSGLLLGGTAAFADSADNDGVNVGNDNNVSVAPVQLCDNNVAVLGAVVSLVSPQTGSCVNAPVVDHPQTAQQDPATPPEQCAQATECSDATEQPCATQCSDDVSEQPCATECSDVTEQPCPAQCSDDVSGELPAAQDPAAEDPAAEAPVADEPAATDPAATDPAGAEPVSDSAESVPVAPAPDPVPGHHAVTG